MRPDIIFITEIYFNFGDFTDNLYLGGYTTTY